MNWSYIAGIVDGEGSVLVCNDLTRGTQKAVVTIPMTNLDVLTKIQNYTKMGNICAPTKRKRHWKQSYVYSISAHKVVENFLLHIQPYLIVKKKNCITVLKFIRDKEWGGRKDIDMCTLRRYHSDGLSLRKIAKKMNISAETVRRRLSGNRSGTKTNL